MTRRTFCTLLAVGFVAGLANELLSDEDDDGTR